MLKYKNSVSQIISILTFEFSRICFGVLNTSDALFTYTEFGKLFLPTAKNIPSEIS
jgi:hypothetical protein